MSTPVACTVGASVAAIVGMVSVLTSPRAVMSYDIIQIGRTMCCLVTDSASIAAAEACVVV